MFSGAFDGTQSHRPLVNIYRTNGKKSARSYCGRGRADLEPGTEE